MIDWYHRLIAVGSTTSGKSELINLLWSQLRCQRLLLDVKNEFTVPDVEPVAALERIDWQAPIIHVVPRAWRAGDYDALFARAFEQRHLSIAVHEFAAVCEFKPGLTGPNVVTYISQGAAHGLGLLAATQRPVTFPVSGMTEAHHVVAIVPKPARQEDLQRTAEAMDLSRDELADELRALEAQHGRYSFLWYDRFGQNPAKITAWPPLPEMLRARSIVRRRTVVGATVVSGGG